MGHTNKKYPEREIAILTKNYPDHANERAKEGDIIAIRDSHYVVGRKEKTEYIWLRVEGEEEAVIAVLNELNLENETIDEAGEIHGDRFDKRRYCVPLHRLKDVFPSFNIERARDPRDTYQPFMVVDEDTGEYLCPQKPLNISGLIFDKKTGEYL